MTQPDTERGLYRKYDVRKVKHETDQRGELVEVLVPMERPVFVLDYAKDPHARKALLAYVESCAESHPHLAHDLLDRYEATT